MSLSPTPSPPSTSGAHAMLADLCRPFVGASFVADGVVIEPNEIPFPDDSLLVHHNHMTVELERHFGDTVHVHVRREDFKGDAYTRLIELTCGPRRVECGIARLNLKYLTRDVADEIMARKTPLGAILIKHDVHRRIKPRHFMRFDPGSAVMGLFEPVSTPVFGRLGTIYCHHEPAIELLEVVVNARATTAAETPRR